MLPSFSTLQRYAPGGTAGMEGVYAPSDVQTHTLSVSSQWTTSYPSSVTSQFATSYGPSVSYQWTPSYTPNDSSQSQQEEFNYVEIWVQANSGATMTQDSICMLGANETPDDTADDSMLDPSGANILGWVQEEEIWSPQPNVELEPSAEIIIISDSEDDEMPAPLFSTIGEIFGATCPRHISKQCDLGKACTYSHEFAFTEDVSATLKRLPTIDLNMALEYMLDHDQLFGRYFEKFCDLYGYRGDDRMLLALYRCCEEREEGARYLSVIYINLTKCYGRKTEACEQMLEFYLNQSLPYVEALVDIILDAGFKNFKHYLEKFLKVSGFRMDFLQCRSMIPTVLRECSYETTLTFMRCYNSMEADEKALMNASPQYRSVLGLLLNVLCLYFSNNN